MIVRKFKVTKFEVSGTEYKVEDIQGTIPSMVDASKIRGGDGNSFLFNKNKIRAYELKNGDVFLSGAGAVEIYFQYEDKYLYEVESIGTDEFGQDIWNKTGRMAKPFKNLSEIEWENI